MKFENYALIVHAFVFFWKKIRSLIKFLLDIHNPLYVTNTIVRRRSCIHLKTNKLCINSFLCLYLRQLRTIL